MTIRDQKRRELMSGLESHFNPSEADPVDPALAQEPENQAEPTPETVVIDASNDDDIVYSNDEPSATVDSEPDVISVQEDEGDTLPIPAEPAASDPQDPSAQEPLVIDASATAEPGTENDEDDPAVATTPVAEPAPAEPEPATTLPEPEVDPESQVPADDDSTIVYPGEGSDPAVTEPNPAPEADPAVEPTAPNATTIEILEDATSEEATDGADISEVPDVAPSEDLEAGNEGVFDKARIWLADRRMGNRKAIMPKILNSELNFGGIAKVLQKRIEVLNKALTGVADDAAAGETFELDTGLTRGVFTTPTDHASTAQEHLVNLGATIDFIERLQKSFGSKVPALSKELVDLLERHDNNEFSLDAFADDVSKLLNNVSKAFNPFIKSKLRLKDGKAEVEADASQGLTGSVFLMRSNRISGFESKLPVIAVMAAPIDKAALKGASKQQYAVLGASECRSTIELIERTQGMIRAVQADYDFDFDERLADLETRASTAASKEEIQRLDELLLVLWSLCSFLGRDYYQIYNAAVVGSVTASVMANRSIARLKFGKKDDTPADPETSTED